MKRIILFALTNVAVVAVLGLMSSLFGINRFLTANGLNLGTLLGFALVMGFTGAIISLLMSKLVAKWSMGVQIINDSPDGTHQWIKLEVFNADAAAERRLQKASIGIGGSTPANRIKKGFEGVGVILARDRWQPRTFDDLRAGLNLPDDLNLLT